MVMAELRD